jgi:anti-anti-sigma factor
MVGSWFRRRVQQRAAGGRGPPGAVVRTFDHRTTRAQTVLKGEAPPELTPFHPLRLPTASADPSPDRAAGVPATSPPTFARRSLLVQHSPAHRSAPDAEQLLAVTTLPGTRPGRVVVEVTGEVDTYTAPLLGACLDSQSGRRGLRELIVDLEQVTILGTAGVAALAQARRRCRMRGARLVVRCGGRRRVLFSSPGSPTS